jgi:5-methylcytosine-specific restriction endonuclease McrA
MRHRLAARFSWSCHYCGVPVWCASCNRAGPPEGFLPGEAATIDHVVPRYLGGSKRISNLVLACWDCNQDKGSLRLEDWLGQYTEDTEPADEPEPAELPDLDTGLDTLRAMWNGRR